MKRIAVLLLIILTVGFNHTAKAQAWGKETKVLGIGFAAASYFHLGSGNRFYPGFYSRFTGQFNFYGEFGIHKYVGLGFTTGIGGAGNFGGYYPEVNVPVGMIANFHFYQLIADKASRDIHADKLDIYAGLSVGSGISVIFDNRNTGNAYLFPLIFVGPHVGIRYYFVERVGVNAELGYGKSLIQAGFVFKL